jgi:hypothetical protein
MAVTDATAIGIGARHSGHHSFPRGEEPSLNPIAGFLDLTSSSAPPTSPRSIDARAINVQSINEMTTILVRL